MREKLFNYREATEALLALATRETMPGIVQLQRQHVLASTFLAVFPETELLDDWALEQWFEKALRDTDIDRAMVSARKEYQPTKSRTKYHLYPNKLDGFVKSSLQRTKILGVGGGPGTILNLSPLMDSGVTTQRITVADKMGEVGGLWVADPLGAASQFNNPRIVLQGSVIDGDRDGRTNRVMQKFLVSDLGSRLQDRVVKGNVERLIHAPLGMMAQLADGKVVGPGIGADITIVSLGSEPLPMRSKKITTNAEEFKTCFERWQRPFTRSEATNLHGKKVLIVGFGNSALNQYRFIEEANNKFGVWIEPVILTHFTSMGINDENREHVRADSTIDRLTRDLINGKTLNLETDIESSNDRFMRLRRNSTFFRHDNRRMLRALGLKGIIPSVRECSISFENGVYSAKVWISIDHEGEKGGSYEIGNIGALFYLAGYGVEPDKLSKLGIIPRNGGRALVRPHDGAAIKSDGSVDSSVIVTGFASADDEYAHSVGTMPGMVGRLPNVLWTSLMLAATKKSLNIKR